ncbi:hypothetical protein M404DRAFT_22212 [Pisolithus tinctorius Marx 270]|uniref:Uncharacterized protein n=1 Tax=Pisolithus tinctorius Marx 270 TaxID=870435 RepID=A0A0C3PL31_PISTI|nr:hypothetical protein M404DRAFT_22212 [Pisolithus tinctorius Marx 270]
MNVSLNGQLGEHADDSPRSRGRQDFTTIELPSVESRQGCKRRPNPSSLFSFRPSGFITDFDIGHDVPYYSGFTIRSGYDCTRLQSSTNLSNARLHAIDAAGPTGYETLPR